MRRGKVKDPCNLLDFDGLVQERRNSSALQWSYVFRALTHRLVSPYHKRKIIMRRGKIKDPCNLLDFDGLVQKDVIPVC